MRTSLLTWLSLGCAAYFTAACTGPQERLAFHASTPPRGFIMKEWTDAGTRRPYVVYVPREYDPSRSWPCILFLHGKGESGSDGLKMAIQGIGSAIQWNQAAWPCVVVMPQKPNQNSAWEDHEVMVLGMLDATMNEYNIDQRRVTITGLSQGGHGTWAIASRHPRRFAAIAPICGYARPMTPETIARGVADLPVWAFHGLADDVVRPEETTSIIEAIRREREMRSGGVGSLEIRMTLYEGVNHNSWDRAYREEGLAQWLLAQVTPQDPAEVPPRR